MFEASTYEAANAAVNPGDLLVLYSDGITEAENPAGQPFEESGLERFLAARGSDAPAVIAPALMKAVESHAADSRFTDDLTVLVVKRSRRTRRAADVTKAMLSRLVLIFVCSWRRRPRNRPSRRPTALICWSRRSSARSNPAMPRRSALWRRTM